jgi:uncharacterized protein (DUF849 family)
MSALAESSRRTALAGIDAFYLHVEEMHGADVLDQLLFGDIVARRRVCLS